MLSRRQFGELGKTLRSGGGFSVNIHTGKSPETGFMVAAPGSKEGKYPAPTVHGGQIHAWTQLPYNHKELQRSDRYLGGWGGRTVATLDVAQNIPHNPKVVAEYGESVAHADARTSALDLMYARNEEAAYDLNKKNPDGTTGADLANPVYDPDRPKNVPGQ